MTDGLSKTLALSEVRQYQPALRNGGMPVGANVPPPNDPTDVAAYGGAFATDWSHTEWVNGEVLQSGATTTFPPNTLIPYVTGGQTYDVDFTSALVSPAAPQHGYRVVTARSFHSGGVNAAMMDGSVRFASSDIAQTTWRALGTRASSDVPGDF